MPKTARKMGKHLLLPFPCAQVKNLPKPMYQDVVPTRFLYLAVALEAQRTMKIKIHFFILLRHTVVAPWAF